MASSTTTLTDGMNGDQRGLTVAPHACDPCRSLGLVLVRVQQWRRWWCCCADSCRAGCGRHVLLMLVHLPASDCADYVEIKFGGVQEFMLLLR